MGGSPVLGVRPHLVVALALGFYVIAALALPMVIGTQVGILAAVPMVVVGLAYGLRGAVAAFPFLAALLLASQALIYGNEAADFVRAGGGLGFATLLVVGFIAAWLRASRRRSEHLVAQLRDAEASERRRRTELDALHQVARSLAGAGTFEQRLQGAVGRIAASVGADAAVFGVSEGDGVRIIGRSRRVPGLGKRQDSYLRQGPAQQALAENRIIHVGDYANHAGASAAIVAQGIRAIVALPVTSREEAAGVLVVSSSTPQYFDEPRTQLLSAVAGSIGVLIDNARLLAAEQSNGRLLRALYRIASTLTRPQPFAEKAQAALDEISRLSEGAQVTLMVPDTEAQVLRALVSAQGGRPHAPPTMNVPFDEGISGECYATGRPVMANSYVNRPDARDDIVSAGIESGLALPVRIDGQPAAVLVASSSEVDFFSTETQATLESVAEALGALLDNARLQQRLDEQLVVQKRKDTFLSVASHELRTPLTWVLGYAELLANDRLAPDQTKDAIEAIHQGSLRLEAIIGELLDLSRIQSDQFTVNREPIYVPDLISEACTVMEPRLAGHEVSVDITPDGELVIADHDKLLQVVLNLMDNAAKYSPDGGPVTITCRASGQDDVALSVSDEGIGMSVAEQQDLFTMFYRVRNPETEQIAGTGLGLYIVKELASRMEGRVWAASEPGQGTTISISLPRAVAEEAA